MKKKKKKQAEPKEVVVPPSPILFVFLKQFYFVFFQFFKEYLTTGAGHDGVL